jgi:hypothetical protein
MVFKWRDDHTQLVLDLLSTQECLWNVKSENYRNRNTRDKILVEMVKQFNIADSTGDGVKLKVHLPPFWNRLPRSLLWNRVNSYRSTAEFNLIESTALINLGTRVNAALGRNMWPLF